MAIAQRTESPGRYRPEPSVLTALRTPRILTREVLAALVVAMALIPEAISFSIIAGVDPRVGLFASFTMAVTTAIVGGRPAMISAATGAVALVVAPLSHAYGVGHLLAAIILGGVGTFLGVFVAFLANATPTLNTGDKVNVITPQGEPNKTIVV